MVSPKRESRVNLRGDSPKAFEHHHRKDNERESDKDSSRNQYGRDSHRYSSRSSYGYSRHDEYCRRDEKYSRDKYDSSQPRSKDKEKDSKEKEQNRNDRNFRDEKRDYHRSFGHKKSDCASHYVESKGYKNEEKIVYGFENQESQVKKPKLFRSGWDDEEAVANEKQKQVSEVDVKATNSKVANDLNAAKVAALRAAELVNKNLVGVGFMSTEQKKKLLWGNKKATTSQEQSGNRWDTSSFDDRERQEKFKKLMGVKGDVNVEQKPEAEKGDGRLQVDLDLEKQYTAGLRRRDGRTVGLGL